MEDVRSAHVRVCAYAYVSVCGYAHVTVCERAYVRVCGYAHVSVCGCAHVRGVCESTERRIPSVQQQQQSVCARAFGKCTHRTTQNTREAKSGNLQEARYGMCLVIVWLKFADNSSCLIHPISIYGI